ncbi:hypothetical protein [Streptomyces sp. 039-1]|uniref:hypothetical protein n=1 Tax=Streptomyces sp. 039-1 TaxID=2789263 RepID=UPI0039F5288B
MNSEEEEHSPLRDIAQNPHATAQYLANVQRTLRKIESDLETLAFETGLHLRNNHLEGDRFYHPGRRARPVERELDRVLRAAQRMAKGLEKSAYARHAHDEVVVNTIRARKEKAAVRAARKNPQLPPAPTVKPEQGSNAAANSDYSEPTSIWTIGGNRESA